MRARAIVVHLHAEREGRLAESEAGGIDTHMHPAASRQIVTSQRQREHTRWRPTRCVRHFGFGTSNSLDLDLFSFRHYETSPAAVHPPPLAGRGPLAGEAMPNLMKPRREASIADTQSPSRSGCARRARSRPTTPASSTFPATHHCSMGRRCTARPPCARCQRSHRPRAPRVATRPAR